MLTRLDLRHRLLAVAAVPGSALVLAVVAGLTGAGAGVLVAVLVLGGAAATGAALAMARATRRSVLGLERAATTALHQLTDRQPGGTAVPSIGSIHTDDPELAGVGERFNRLIETSVGLLDEQIQAQQANQQLFVSLGRRQQNLVGRQLRFIDQLERAETDPDALAALFRLDHLATRMRRNAESLLVIAGLDSPRQWKHPAPAQELARAAAAEAEQYDRVGFGRIDPVWVSGTAVANVVHLLAELIDNAVRYSPPDTAVTVTAEQRGDRLVFGIADLGMGLAAPDLEALNERLARRDALAPVPAGHLGLAVVARLAGRHDIDVHLESTGAEGMTAWVELPADVLTATAPLPSGSRGPETPPAAGPQGTIVAPSPGHGAGAREPASPSVSAFATRQPGTESEPGPRTRPIPAVAASPACTAGASSSPELIPARIPAASPPPPPAASPPPPAAAAPSRRPGHSPAPDRAETGAAPALLGRAPTGTTSPPTEADSGPGAAVTRTSAGFVKRVPGAHAATFGPPADGGRRATSRDTTTAAYDAADGEPAAGTTRSADDLRARLERFTAGRAQAAGTASRASSAPDPRPAPDARPRPIPDPQSTPAAPMPPSPN